MPSCRLQKSKGLIAKQPNGNVVKGCILTVSELVLPDGKAMKAAMFDLETPDCKLKWTEPLDSLVKKHMGQLYTCPIKRDPFAAACDQKQCIASFGGYIHKDFICFKYTRETKGDMLLDTNTKIWKEVASGSGNVKTRAVVAPDAKC